MLPEGSQRDDLSARGIPLVAQVEVAHITVAQVEVALYVGGEIEVVIDRRRHLSKLGAVDAPSIAHAQLVLRQKVVSDIERWKPVALAVVMALVALDSRLGVGD